MSKSFSNEPQMFLFQNSPVWYEDDRSGEHAFDAMDSDQDGWVSHMELTNFMTYLGNVL